MTPNLMKLGFQKTPINTFKKSLHGNLRDKYCWQFSKDNVSNEFWDRILGHFDSWESQTWQDILVASSKQNHHIEVNRLNKIARDRLQQLHIEVESVVSLRLSGNHRLYGIMDGSSFCIEVISKLARNALRDGRSG